MVRLRQRDPQAIGLLYDRYGNAAYSMALHIVGNPAWAESLVAEAMLKCWNRVGSFKETRAGALGVWLLITVYANALDHRRSVDAGLPERPGLPIMLENEAILQDWFRNMDAERVQDAHGALHKLDAEEREVLHLAFFRGLDPAELTVRLGRPQADIDKLIHAALAKLAFHESV
jgi:RNA polymerase sigma-70 factor (ECF subfamily)